MFRRRPMAHRSNVPHELGHSSGAARERCAGRSLAALPAHPAWAWYRKRFSLPATAAGRRIFVEFDGVMANSQIWINGQRVGGRPVRLCEFRL